MLSQATTGHPHTHTHLKGISIAIGNGVLGFILFFPWGRGLAEAGIADRGL